MRRLLTREESARRNAGRLLDAAETVFIERGYHATTVGAVAARAGLTTGAIYSRFGSKADLSLALIEFWTSAGRDPALLERFSESHRRLMSAIGEVIDDAAARIGVELAIP